MELSFKNIGAVKNTDVDLSKRLIIFCGPNGTGKTYVSYAIYGYLRTLLLGVPIFKLNELINNKKISKVIDFGAIYDLKENYLNHLQNNVSEIFGVKSSKYFSDFQANISLDKKAFIKILHKASFDTTITFDSVSINYQKAENSEDLQIQLGGVVSLEKLSDMTESFHLALLSKYICNESILSARILPVERNAIYTFVDELAINNMQDVSISNENDDRYPMPIKDALITAADLRNVKNKVSPFATLAEEIETNILHGQVSISDDGSLRFLSDKTSELKLPIHLTASVIKNISGLLVYLKHQASKDELLIIDEPEIGLHPDNQILLARVFAKLINKGLRLLINTHSDYIIRELNNLIMLSSDKPALQQKAKELGYKDDEKINPNDVGAYLFNYNTDNNCKVEVVSLPVDDTGFSVSTIDKTISALNEVSEELFYQLKYSENE